ncbi:MAG TPA: ABC transporter ATP-binding protein [Arachnia sp.]|nr:ABC transporter ATP-binding protein [Arachnia sp.]HMT85012.1 ABC transporter ATP-binding protein [Arachnia sp.]
MSQVSRYSAVRTALSGRRVLLAFSILGLVGHQIAEALVPVVIGTVLDEAIAPGEASALLLWLGVLSALFVALFLSWRLGELSAVRTSEEGARAVRRTVVARVLSRAGFVRPRTPGELLSIAEADADRTAGIVWVVGSAAAKVAAILTAAVALLAISVPIGVLVLVATPVLVVLLHLFTAPLERRMDAEQAAAAEASSIAADLLTGLRALSGIQAEAAAVTRFAHANRSSLDASRRAVGSKAAYTAASMAGSTILLTAIAAAAATAAAAGTITVGQLVAVLGLAQFLHWPVSDLAFVGAELAGVRASSTRIGAVIDEPRLLPDETPGLTAPSRGPGAPEIVFEDVETPHAGPLTTTVAPGEHRGLQFDDPRGATEFQELLAGLRRPTRGRVLIAGKEHRPGDTGTILAPPHQGAVFAGTLRDNVAFHRPLSDEDLADAAHTAALEDVLTAGGWQLAIGERGLTLSGGQRQRVALARALAGCAPGLVLHDPTSALDSVTETAIAARLRSDRAGLTTILLSPGPALLHSGETVTRVASPSSHRLQEVGA